MDMHPTSIMFLLYLTFQVIRRQFILSDEIVLEDLSLPGLSELRGRWHGSLDASGGGNGDTMVDLEL